MSTATRTEEQKTLAEKLREKREKIGLTIAEAALRTKLPERQLAFFENSAAGELPDDIYARIYLKAYGKFLGLDADELLLKFREERELEKRGKNSRAHPAAPVPTLRLLVTPRIVRGILLCVAAASLALYLALEIKRIFAPPSVYLSSPADGLITAERSVLVEGKTEAETVLRINGKEISPDDTGRFADELPLHEGLNVVKVMAAKKYSRPMIVERRIVVVPK